MAPTHQSSRIIRALRRWSARGGIALLITSLLALSTRISAGDLNSDTNQMFNDLGAMGNYTAPGAFRGQVYNTYTGGSFYLRSPNKTYQLAALQFPNAKGGCGGIDVFGGSMSHISSTEFKNMLKNITAALPGIAFQLALEAVSPLLGGMTKWAKSLETMLTNARINSCETATAMVSSVADATGYSSHTACEKLAMTMGLATDADDANRQCSTNRAGILGQARNSNDPNISSQAPFVGNLTWQALKTVTTLDDQERQVIMSMVGTLIVYPDENNQDPKPIPPTLTSMTQLLYGQSDAGGGNINIDLLQCDDVTACMNPTENPNYVHTPFTTLVQNLMVSISTHIANRQALPNPSQELGFVNQTSEPVYRMLSIGKSIPGSGLADDLIAQYRDVIAADYAYNFLDQNLRVGMTALEKDYRLDRQSEKKAGEIRARAQAMMSQLAREKSMLYTKVASFTSVAGHLEQLERQLRTSMPQSVIDMLGFEASVGK